MMYSNKLVCSVKVNNKILREKTTNNESTVYVPFGSEYSLLLKNLGGRNAVVNIEIDGRKVCKDGFYINAGQTAEIERFVDNLKTGRRFKFIEKTDEISDFRGDRIDDGMIRVTWQFEAAKTEIVKKTIVTDHYHYNHHYLGCNCIFCRRRPYFRPYWHYGGNTIMNQSIGSVSSSNSSCENVYSSSVASSDILSKQSLDSQLMRSVNYNDSGITVEGSKSNQQFSTVHADELETNIHSMVIILKGTKDKIVVQKPVVVNEKLGCPTCGRKWKSNFEFCGNCGTALK